MSPSLELMMNPHGDGTYADDPLGADVVEEEEDEVDETEYDDCDDAIDSSNGITKPGEHDVLLGRGGGTNNHCGNVKFRKLVNEHKMRYLACSKVDKPKVARDVVALWRKLDPTGRFLARKDETKRGPGSVKSLDNIWYEVGDKKAREKASQCLRERTPDVMPYIKHLRDQQNAITEQGVSLVQQQMQMQEQAQQLGIPFQPVFPTMTTSGGPGFQQQRRNSMPVPPPMGIPVRPQQGGGGGGSNSAAAQMNARRGSLPVSQHMGVPMQGQQLPGGVSPMQQQQQAFGRRPNPQQMMNQQQQQQQMMMMAQHQQQQHMMANSGRFNAAGGVGVFNGNNGANVSDDEEEYYDDLNDMEYQQSMMMMQQQVQMQQMQIQRMQEQQKLIHQQNRMQMRGNGGGGNTGGGRGVQHGMVQPMMPMSYDGSTPMPMQQPQQPNVGNGGGGNVPRRGVGRNRSGMMMVDSNDMNNTIMQGGVALGPSYAGAPNTNASTLIARGGVMPRGNIPQGSIQQQQQQQLQQQQQPQQAAALKNGFTPKSIRRSQPLKSAPSRHTPTSLDVTEKIVTPDTNVSSSANDIYASIQPADPDADNELSLVEYRQQLEEYISNSSNQTSCQNDTNDFDANGLHLKFDDGNDNDNESDLEDDWEKEKEKAYQQLKERSGDKVRRGVNRNLSGVSMMSTGMSLASGMTGLSDMLTATSDQLDDVSEAKNFARSISSNLSLMSELTDLSQNIDTLSLNDNDNGEEIAGI